MHKFINKIINHKRRSTFKVHDCGQDTYAYNPDFNEYQFNIYSIIVIYHEKINLFSGYKRFIFVKIAYYSFFLENLKLS